MAYDEVIAITPEEDEAWEELIRRNGGVHFARTDDVPVEHDEDEYRDG